MQTSNGVVKIAGSLRRVKSQVVSRLLRISHEGIVNNKIVSLEGEFAIMKENFFCRNKLDNCDHIWTNLLRN